MKKIIIIGGGVAGLSAGIFAQKSGFESVIYDKNDYIGGLCTGYDKFGVHVDGCIRFLSGTKEGEPLIDLWNQVGALENTELIKPEYSTVYEFNEGRVIIWRDIDKLEKDLLAISPEDESLIKELINDTKKLHKIVIPADKPMYMMNPLELAKVTLSMNDAVAITDKLNKISCEKYASRFKHPLLQKTFSFMMPKEYSATALIMVLAGFTMGNVNIPKGGSRALTQRMKNKYESLGGKILLNSEVSEVIIEKNKATGIQLKNGSTEKADYIVAACDLNLIFEKFLRDEFEDKEFSLRFENPQDYPLSSAVNISVVIEADMRKYPITICFQTEPYKVAERTFELTGFKNYSYDETFGVDRTIGTISIIQSEEEYNFWKSLYSNKEAYNAEKIKVAIDAIKRIESKFPELKGKVKLLDVATPMTYERYTGAYRGSTMAFALTPKSKVMMHSGKLKGLDKFYISGQWVSPPGGLVAAVTSGKFTILQICKEEKVKLVTN